jgi:hypothetical protein
MFLENKKIARVDLIAYDDIYNLSLNVEIESGI